MTRDLGWDVQRQEAWDKDPLSIAGAVPGRVVRVERTTAHIRIAGDTVTIHAADLVVGDWVATDGSTWARRLPRRTQLTRQSSDRTSNEQALAANVDAVIIVEPSSPTPSLRRIERMLTLAWASGARPVVVLTKKDLAERDVTDDAAAVAFGVEVLSVSSATGEGLDALAGLLDPDQTFVLIGPSGAGKSSLVNALAGADILSTGEVRPDGRGRHTTTRRELIAIDGLGCLIDTPGIRAVGMTASEEGVGATFEDILSFAHQCRFNDCAHEFEPGCAVMDAVEDGSLDPERFSSYKRIEREISHQRRRKEAHSRSDERLDTKGRRTAVRVVMTAKGRRTGR